PDWSHLLGGRPHSSVSALSAHLVLLAVGCRLSITPTPDALREAARCHSVDAVRRLLTQVYGERGLAIAYQLAGWENPYKIVGKSDKIAGRVDRVTGGDATASPPHLLSPEVLRSLP